MWPSIMSVHEAEWMREHGYVRVSDSEAYKRGYEDGKRYALRQLKTKSEKE